MDNHKLARACETEQDVGAAAGMRQWEGYPEVVHLLDFVNSVLHSLIMWLVGEYNPCEQTKHPRLHTHLFMEPFSGGLFEEF